MTTRNIWKGTAKWCTACLVFLCLWVLVPGAWAAYEVSVGNITANVPINTATRWTDNLTVQWTAPSMTGSDVLQGFAYKWNNSATLLDDTVFNWTTGNDGTVNPSATPFNASKASADLAGLDSGSLLYLHIKTWYLDATTTGQPAYSSDVVYGPFLIDNVAPTGTVRIVDSTGNTDVTATSDTIVYLKLAASKDPIKMYLSETSVRPATDQDFAADAVYQLGETTPGTKTIYVWFKDSVGNISATPATDSFTLLAPISISPNTANLDLATGATQVFRVEGTNATYNWTIINEKNEAGGAATAGTIAHFTTSATGQNSVTVQGLVKGSFQLQAGALTSGTITVTQSSVSKTFSLQTTAKTNVNAIGFVLENTGITTAHQLGTAVGNCDLVSRWDEATQSYSSHPMAVQSANNFALEVGKAYFVSVTTAHDFTLTGSVPSSKAVNLVTTAKTNVNAVGMPKSKEATCTTAHQLGQDIGNVDLVSRWDVPTQSYSSHPMAVQSANNFAIQWGNGYFVSVTQQKTWNW